MGDADAPAALEAEFQRAAAGGGRPAQRVPVIRVRDGKRRPTVDHVAGEEPLEVRLGGSAVAVTMRTPTPGEDVELAVGFLAGEGIIDPKDVTQVAERHRPGEDGGAVDVILRSGAEPKAGWQRNFYATSSCGICGKASVDAVRVAAPQLADGPQVAAELLGLLPDRLREAQRVFERTGGLHAAGLFTAEGALLVAREDVGRHNAVDKAIGRAALDHRLPLSDHVLQVSGRASFEIVQKAAVAGVPIVSAVSAPSSLAVGLARELGMTLVGFVRDGGFNVYCGEERLAR